MREAVGGSLLMYLIIPIIIVFILFIGFIMRYASAYRAANYIVTQIESCQGYTDCSSNWDKSVVSTQYHYKGTPRVTCIPSNINKNSSVFRVEMDVDFDLPLFGEFKIFTVKAETKTVHNTCK